MTIICAHELTEVTERPSEKLSVFIVCCLFPSKKAYVAVL